MKKEQLDSNYEECFFESTRTKKNEELLKNVIEKITSSPNAQEETMDCLQKAGICGDDGKYTEYYRTE